MFGQWQEELQQAPPQSLSCLFSLSQHDFLQLLSWLEQVIFSVLAFTVEFSHANALLVEKANNRRKNISMCALIFILFDAKVLKI